MKCVRIRSASTEVAQRIGNVASLGSARSIVRNTPFSIAGSISSVSKRQNVSS